jgi:hypothetical protein
MTELLRQAFDELSKRTSDEQDAVAALILAELEDDRRWDEAFARSQGKLNALAARAREARDAGRTKNIGWDEL